MEGEVKKKIRRLINLKERMLKDKPIGFKANCRAIDRRLKSLGGLM